MTKKALIAAGLSLMVWFALWAAIAQDLYSWEYSCGGDEECEWEDSVRNAAERSTR